MRASILIFTCSLLCAIHLDLQTDQFVDGFIRSMKYLIEKKGRLPKIYSDKGKIFQAAHKWLREIDHSEILYEHYSREDIKLQFKHGRDPCVQRSTTRTTATTYLKARPFKPCSTFQYVLWEPNILVSLDNSLHTNNEHNTSTHYTYL